MRTAADGVSSIGGHRTQPLFPGPDGSICPVNKSTEDAQAGRAINFPTRTLIYHQGDLADWIYQISQGAVMLSKLLPDGRRQIVEILGPGDVFGCASTPIQECSAETLAAARCMAFDRGCIERSPTLMRDLSSRLYVQLCSLQEHVALLGRKTAMERIASFLMRWVPRRGGYHCPGPPSRDDGANLRLAMSRQEIADYLGLTIETVSRTFTKLKRLGVVSINRLDEVCVHDVCQLCRMTGTHLTLGRWCSSREETLIKDPWL
jgi:CRP/FNR family nitrogen fixation transcriptional regulator